MKGAFKLLLSFAVSAGLIALLAFPPAWLVLAVLVGVTAVLFLIFWAVLHAWMSTDDDDRRGGQSRLLVA